MENKVLSANLNAIAKYDKALCDEILRINKVKSTFELIQNQNGEYNLVFNSCALHSSENAKKEASDIVDKITDPENKNSVRIIWGLGLGYLADEFISKVQGVIIIFEPNLEILRSVFEILEFSENLSKKNVLVVNTIDKLLEWIDILADKETKITISFLTSYLNLFKEDIYKTAKTVERIRGEKQANTNTINKIAPLATINTLFGLDKILKTPLVKSLEGIFDGKCALIASSGPSLEENIETIKQNRDKFILFAVGPSLKLLDNHGIKPDFLCIVEAMDTRGQMEGIDISNTNLIFEPFSNPYLWELNVKNRFLFFSRDNFLNDWLAQTLNIDISNTKSVGTVSYCALSSAKIMGFKKIILCGQNLAFKDGKCYAKGSAYEDLECVLNPATNKFEIRAKDFKQYEQKLLGSKLVNLKRAESYAENYITRLNKTLYTVVGQKGEMLPTQACYALFIKHFEQFTKDNPQITYINSSTGGAQINGFENMTLEEALIDCKNTERADIKFEIPNYDIEKFNLAKESLLQNLLRIKSTVDIALKYQDEYNREFARRKAFTKNTDKIEEKIIKILSDFIKNNYPNPAIYFLCASSTNGYFENLKKIKANQNPIDAEELVSFNLKLLKNLKRRINRAIRYLSDK